MDVKLVLDLGEMAQAASVALIGFGVGAMLAGIGIVFGGLRK